MSTRGTTYYDADEPMDWEPQPRPWCPSCCVPHCGCPDEPVLSVPANVVLGSE